MNAPRYAAGAARLLSKPEPPRASGEHERARGVGSIERALASRRKRRLQARAAGGILTIAAGCLVWFSWPSADHAPPANVASITTRRRLRFGTVSLASGAGAGLSSAAGELAVHRQLEVESGTRISTPKDGAAELELTTGTRIQVDGSSSVSVLSHDQRQSFRALQRQSSRHGRQARGGRTLHDGDP